MHVLCFVFLLTLWICVSCLESGALNNLVSYFLILNELEIVD